MRATAIKRCLFASLCLVSAHALAQDAFPAKMEGKYFGQYGGGKTTLELVKMEGQEKAHVKFYVWSDKCDHGIVDGVADKKEGGWQISAPSIRCASWTINLKLVEGKQKLEGKFQADSGNYGTVYYEW